MLGTRIREMSSHEELETSSQDRQMSRMPRTDYHLVTHNLKEELLDGTGDSRREQFILPKGIENGGGHASAESRRLQMILQKRESRQKP